jgi:diguanylate cyclase (GGDEF)-like protein
VLIPDITHRTDAERLAVRLLTVIAQPHALPDGNQVGLSASIGIALAPEHGRDPEKLLQLADLAMYQAKLAGKNRYAFAAAAPAASATITPIGSRSARAV